MRGRLVSRRFFAMFISDELGMRRDVMSKALASSVCSSVYVAIVMSVIGWQLAIDNSQQSFDTEAPSIGIDG